MFRLCFTILTVGLLSAAIPKAALGLSDVYGSSFLFALPTNNQSMTVVHLIMTTLSFNQVKVIFEDYWTKDKIYEQFIISREIRKHFALNESASTSLTTYHLKGTDTFSLTVVAENVFEDNRSLSSFQAVPVAGWGNEYVVMTLPVVVHVLSSPMNTCAKFQLDSRMGVGEIMSSNFFTRQTEVRFHPSIIIVTIFDNKISIRVRSSAFQFHVVDKLNVNQTKTLDVLIKSYNSYSIDACGIGKADLRDLHGTLIKGQYAFGVIIGSCYTEPNNTPCKSAEKNSDIYQTTDMITEMHLPVGSFGLDFVVFGLPSARGSGNHFIMASREQTEVSMSGPAIKTRKWSLSEKGEVTQIPEVWQPMLLLSDKPICVYFILLSSCDDATEALGGALSLILPVSLHMDAYFWHTQSLEEYMTHYLFYLWRKEDNSVILELDDVVIRRYLRNVSYIPTFMFTWEAGEVEISEGPHQFFSRSGVKFGVYLYGFGDTVAYMHLAGFISRNSLGCVANGVPEPGDLIDNDCDGWIDEERNDSTDDDQDGLVDEDLLPLPPRSGNWGEWQPWWCTHCTSNVLSRKRQCNMPPPTRGGLYCYGDENSSIAGDCKEICEMSHGSWGPWSEWTCTKDCSFLNGIRIRTCSNPAPSRNGSHCEGAHILEREDSNCIRKCTKISRDSILAKINNATDIMDNLIGRPGTWGEWTEWSCVNTCGHKPMWRHRKCDKPAPVLDGNDCFGPPHQFTEDLLCFIICQDDCPQGTWDLNCSKDCSQCLHDCNKYTGECDQCLAGFKNPNRSCSVACEIDEYGHMCKESCTDKCLGEDCIDRVYGTCPIITTFMQYYHYMFLFLPFGILFFLRQFTGMMAGNPWQDFFYPPQR